MRKILLYLLSLISLSSVAQKEVIEASSLHPIDLITSRTHFGIASRVSIDTASVQTFALDFVKLKEGNELQLASHIQSPAAHHFLFQQFYNGVKIYRSEVKINVANNGRILSLFDLSFVVNNIEGSFASNQLLEQKLRHTFFHFDELNMLTEKILFWDGKIFQRAIRVELSGMHDIHCEKTFSGEGKELYQKDLNAYFHTSSIDTPATAMIFNPDPLTAANETYGLPYKDNDDADANVLNNERETVNIDVTYEAGEFVLESQYCKISDHSFPTVAPASSSTPNFDYTREQDGFEDVNAFYHINTFQEYIQLLGFTNLASYQILVDCHGLNGSDQSNFSSSPSPRLNFGEGGVDDAEDADVIVHEYGHAISNSAAPGTNSGAERQALDEALGDYLASSYSRSLNPFKWENVFSWDGHNEFWSGRSSVSTDHYPEDLNFNLYTDTDIWSATLMQIWGDIGREKTDANQLQALYSYSSNITMRDAAYLYIQADTLLHGANNIAPIHDRMYTRGLLPLWIGIDEAQDIEKVKLLNSSAFANGSGNAVFQFEESLSASIQIYALNGKLLQSAEIKNQQSYSLSPESFKAGVYFISLRNSKGQLSFKLIKL